MILPPLVGLPVDVKKGRQTMTDNYQGRANSGALSVVAARLGLPADVCHHAIAVNM
jgi:hypothetical protein